MSESLEDRIRRLQEEADAKVRDYTKKADEKGKGKK
jgi:hypothetical protein